MHLFYFLCARPVYVCPLALCFFLPISFFRSVALKKSRVFSVSRVAVWFDVDLRCVVLVPPCSKGAGFGGEIIWRRPNPINRPNVIT